MNTTHKSIFGDKTADELREIIAKKREAKKKLNEPTPEQIDEPKENGQASH